VAKQHFPRPQQDYGHDVMVHYPSSVTQTQGEGCQARRSCRSRLPRAFATGADRQGKRSLMRH
jgi:hypothetical protein